MPLTKTLLRVTVIGGLATGGLLLIAGPQRVAMLADQARDAVVTRIDNSIEDPVALRNNLRELEKQYPQRIADLEGELASLDHEIHQLQRDRAVAHRVTELAQKDLDELSTLLEDAKAAREVSPAAIIKVHFNGSRLRYDQAIARAAQIRNTFNAYASRVAEADDTLTVLDQQRGRLTDLLAEIQSEHQEFRAQIAQLDGQIAAIERNEKLITMVEQRERAIREYDKAETVSIDQVKAKLARTQAEQEARLANALNAARSNDYATQAEEMLNREAAAQSLLDNATKHTPTNTNTSAERIDIIPSTTPSTTPNANAKASANANDTRTIPGHE